MGPCTLLQSRDPRHRSGGCAHNSSGVQVWEDLMHRCARGADGAPLLRQRGHYVCGHSHIRALTLNS